MHSSGITSLILNVDLDRLRETLSLNPSLANEEIGLNEDDLALAHPLHRICDGVFERKYSDQDGVRMAEIFLAHGAKVDGNALKEKQDTPLIAACSLRADGIALCYIGAGANLQHQGCHGGTALHWAAWCGRDRIVERLLLEDVNVNKRCVDFEGTPLLWAVHGYRFGGDNNRHQQLRCASLLLDAGADKMITNTEGYCPRDFVADGETAFKALLS